MTEPSRIGGMRGHIAFIASLFSFLYNIVLGMAPDTISKGFVHGHLTSRSRCYSRFAKFGQSGCTSVLISPVASGRVLKIISLSKLNGLP